IGRGGTLLALFFSAAHSEHASILESSSEDWLAGVWMKRYLVLAVLLTLVACREQDGLEPVSRTHPRAAQARDDQVNFKFTQASYADAIERAGPGVVTIRAARRQWAAQQPFLADPLSGGLQPDAGRQLALGSGVIVEPDGIILTNHHLTDGSDSIVIELVDRRVFDAKVLGADPPSDLAVLKIAARNLPTLNLGDSDRVRVGDVALAIGNPLGVGQTVTAGIISAKGRSTGFSNGSFEDFLQTDAPINQGNSGGALISARGELIGINSQILSNSGGNIGIGFAIPSNMARNVLQQLLTTGKVRRSRLGVATQPITPETAANLGLTDWRGVVINTVAPNSPAARAGMRQGDVIVAFNGAPVTDGNSLRNHVASTLPGTAVGFTVLRNQHELKIQVILTEIELKNGTS
ncbi:MAG TPA: trypsin-like peptidase domain-containing protein, partial [Candidatus Limnocylindrales bacterium]|nr:trypsin-like peptidase domain-containing protein [Candidatus Limnocylindrales bacterium]